MGPKRFNYELASAYRMRYAAYCFKWLVGLGFSFVVLLGVRPWSDAAPNLFVIFFLYIGLGLSSTAALLAMTGFFIGSLWSGWLESDSAREKAWNRFKCYMAPGIGLALAVFAAYWVIQGILTGETLAISRKGHRVRYAEHGGAFLLTMGFWIWSAVYCPVFAWRKTKEADDQTERTGKENA